MSKLPEKIEENNEEIANRSTSVDEPIKIAWRYASVPKVNSSLTNRRSKTQFDLAKTIDNSLLKSCNISKYPLESCSRTIAASYSELWIELRRVLSLQKHCSLHNATGDSSSLDRSLLRIFVEGELVRIALIFFSFFFHSLL